MNFVSLIRSTSLLSFVIYITIYSITFSALLTFHSYFHHIYFWCSMWNWNWNCLNFSNGNNIYLCYFFPDRSSLISPNFNISRKKNLFHFFEIYIFTVLSNFNAFFANRPRFYSICWLVSGWWIIISRILAKRKSNSNKLRSQHIKTDKSEKQITRLLQPFQMKYEAPISLP